MKKNQNISIPTDFRKRFAQRDLEISQNEQEYLASKRAQQNISDKAETKSLTELKPQYNFEVNIPSIQNVVTDYKPKADLYKTPQGKKKGAPEEKKERLFDIQLPTIQDLVDEYSKPYVYNEQSGKFEQIKDTQELINKVRQDISNRPTPLGITKFEDAYMRATDPVRLLQDVKRKYNMQDEVEDKEEQVNSVLDTFSDVMSTPMHLLGDQFGRKVKDFINSTIQENKDYIDDIISTWNISKNDVEFDAYTDAGIRLGEKLQYANIIQKYNDNLKNYIVLQDQYNRATNTKQRNQLLVQMNNILAQNSQMRQAVEDATTYHYDETVGKSVTRGIAEFINNAISNDAVNAILPPTVISRATTAAKAVAEKAIDYVLGDDIGRYGKRLLDLVDASNLKPGTPIGDDFIAEYGNISSNIDKFNKSFQEAANNQIQRDKDMALQNKREAIEWAEWHTPSKEFKAKEKAALNNYLTDVGTYTHGIWTVLGSSAAFNGTQLLSTGLDWLGMGLLMAPHPAAKIAGGAATAAGGGLGLLSGVYENRGEITQNYIQGLRDDLEKHKKLNKFLEEGKKQLKLQNIPVRDEQDVFRHFILKDYKTNDPVIRYLALQHMFGANNAFLNDMMAVSADVAINTGLNVFGATGKVAEAMKIFPEGSKFAFLRKVAQNPAYRAVYKGVSNVETNALASAISPLANIPYNLVKPVFKGVKSALTPMVKQMSKHMDKLASWAKVAPKAIFNTRTANKYLFDFLGKTTMRGFSEAVEEGKQFEYGQMFANGQFAGASKSMASTLMDDLSTGLYTGLAFIGDQFLGIQADKELMSNMRGGFIGGILNHGTAITAVQDFTSARGEIKAGDLVFNNVMAEKLRQRSNIINGEEMAKYATRSGYVAMMNAFDRMLRIQENITQDASEKVGLTAEELADQRNMFRRIAALANDNRVKQRAKKLGIKEGSADFRKLVSLINTADQIQMENVRDYNQMVELAQEILSNDGLSLDAVNLFNQARAQATSQDQIDALEAAENWAKWAQPLNNQILGQYAALNALIEELQQREGFLTKAEQRNLNHYIAQREKLDKTVADIRSQIGSTENMEFLNQSNPEILTKYSQIYRTLYQASAQLETSTRVLDNLYGKNNASEAANDFVKEQLDFINQKIDKENKDKSKVIKSSKKSHRDAEALAFLEQYKQSVQDDQEFIAELADRFDQESYDANNKLDQRQFEDEAQQEQAEQETEDAGGEPTPGVQGLPVNIYDKAPQEGKQFQVGSVISSESEPGVKLTVQNVKVNPTTGQYLLEATDEKGDVRYIDDGNIQEYQREETIPYDYSIALTDPDGWVKLNEKSPLAQAYRHASIKNLPAVVNDDFREQLEQAFSRPIMWDPYDEDPQEIAVQHLADLQYSYPTITVNPIYGVIVDGPEDHKIYIPSYRDHVDPIYKEFNSEKNARLEIVKKLIEFRDKNELDGIKQLLQDNNISLAYMDVLNDTAALNSIATQLIHKRSPHMQEWLTKLAFYTDPDRIHNNGIQHVVAKNGELVFTNQTFSISASYAYGDIITVDKDGQLNIYILAFPNKPWTDKDLDTLAPNQKVSRRQYYDNLANGLFRQMDIGTQQHVKGIYVLPITGAIHDPIELYVRKDISGLEGEILQREIINDFYHTLEMQVQDFLNNPVIPIKQKSQPDGDGSQETFVENIENDIKQVEDTIAQVNNGTLSFNGRIRVDARQYLENMRGILNKHRNALRKIDQTDNIKSLIQRIENAYPQIMQILSTFRENMIYAEADMQRTGDTVKNNMTIIPDSHPLCARSTSGIPVTATSDFIVNSKVELQYGYIDQNGEIHPLNYYTTYPGAGVYAVFTYNGVKYKPVLVAPSHYKNGVQPYTQEGAEFITQVIELQKQAEGLPIVAEAKRMIPNPIYKGQPKPITQIPALHMTEDDIQELTGESDSVGVANVNNQVQLINKQNDRSFLWTFKSSQSGSLFLMHTFGFKEYPDGGVVPVKLIPAKLTKSDIDAVVNILKNNLLNIATTNRSSLNNRFEINGKETPLTNLQVLNMIVKVDVGHRDRSIFWVDNFGVLYHKDLQKPIDVNTQEGERTLRQMLGNGYELALNKDILSANLGNSNDAIFGGLEKWIRENGSLVISDNVVFDLDDVARNGKGFHGIGWAIRHGRLLSNMSSIYDPSISVSLPKIDSNVAQPEIEQPASEEPKVHKRPKARYVPEEGGLLDSGFKFDGGVEFSTSEEIPEENLNEAEAREDIKRMLGDAAVEFIDEILGVLNNGLKALAAIMDDVIVISRLAGVGTQFHEAFHRIVELLFDEKTRQRLYNAYSRLHPEVDSTNPRSISEGLAEDFKAYALDELSTNLWKRYFARIKRFCQALINKDRRLLYKVYKNAYNGKYRNIKPSQENIDRFNRIFAVASEGRGILYHSIYDASTGMRLNLRDVPSATDYRTAIDTIVDNIISDRGADIFAQSVSKLEFTKESVSNLPLFKGILAKQNHDDIDKIFLDILDHWDNVMGDVASSFKRFGLHFKHKRSTNTIETYKTNLSQEEESAIDAADEGGAKTADINQYELQDYEISKLSKMSERTKYFFATVPDVRFVEEDDGEEMYVPETNAAGEEIDTQGRIVKEDPETHVKYVETEDGSIITEQNLQINLVRNVIPNLNDFGFKQFAPFARTCNIALNHCYQANSLEELLEAFRNLASEYPQFTIIAYRFASLLDSIKLRDKNGYYITTDGRRYSRMDNGLFRQVLGKNFGEEWYTADELEFETNNNAQSMAVSVFNNISGTRLNFKNVRSSRPSKDSIVFQVANTDNGYSARRYSQSWHSTFLTDSTKVQQNEVTRKGERVFEYVLRNSNLFADAASDLRKIVESYTDRHSAGYKTGEITIKGRAIKVNKEPEKVKAEYLRLLSSIGVLVTREQFDHLLFKQFGKTDINALRKYFQQDGEDFGRSKGVSLFKLILAIEQGAKDGKLSRTIISGSFYNRTGALIQLADAIWSFNQSESELMQTAPGKNKYYAVANRNAQDLMIQELNIPGGKMASDLLMSAYHNGSYLLPKLLKGEVYLVSCTNAGYESDNRSDFGSDFMLITNSEDAISKITWLLDGYIVPPTLSNKKTYLPIQVIDANTKMPIPLPGIQYIANKTNVQTNEGTTEVYNATGIPTLVDKTFGGKFISPSGKLSEYKIQRLDKQFVLDDEVYDTLINYAFSEYYAVVEGIQREKSIPDNEKVVNLDVVEKGNAKYPGALRFSRFHTLYIPKQVGDSIEYDEINLNNPNNTPEQNLMEAERLFFGQDVSREQRISIINEMLERNLDDNLKYLCDVGIIKRRNGWRNLSKYSRYEPVAIDSAHLNAVIKAYGRTLSVEGPISARSIALCSMLFDVCVKHQIAMEEYQRMFVGNPALFVSVFKDGVLVNDTGDLSKRLGGHVSTGETQCRLDDVPTTYNQAELRDYKVESSQKDDLDRWFDESESRFVLYADAQKTLSIRTQKIRQNLQSICPAIRSKKYYADFIKDNFPSIFEGIDEGYVDKFAELLEQISKTDSPVVYNELVKSIPEYVGEYKKMLVETEYKRQEDLSLEQVKGELDNKGLLTGAESRIAAYSSNYGKGKINVADGASFVSPIMVKWMLKQIGKFNGKVAKAWNSLQSDDVRSVLDNAVDYHLVTDALFGTQKYTSTGYRMNNGYPIFFYLKTALFPMFKQIAYGKTLDLLRQMEKDNTQLVPFESGMKFGSQGKQAFPQTKEELEGFKFNNYPMEFKWLRKQLNTDPKEAELMAVGTQTKKIALTILDVYKDDYVTRDGKVETGAAIRDRIFSAERHLAEIGREELITRFSSEQEMAKYIRDNLAERDADPDTLQGISLINEDGNVHMMSPLEGLSNVEWIQSIITSLANKHIVDINLPGSAFIQRSVYSMEGNSILGDNQVPSIGKLRISNDWSSMDAVVSIDYFYQQFPILERMSFTEARNWLLSHNLIGENAIADTVAYRIPTQANSSIHALRFIDVISSVRDTIILPEEFTAITGSDFDIDKLFLSSKFFKLDGDNVTTEFDEHTNPKEFYGNQLMECYLELLTQPKNKYANQLVRSIDYDTNIPMKVVKLLQQGGIKPIGSYDALQLYRQCQIKSENRTGGIGVGPYALNNNNEIMSRLFEVECENVGIIKALDISRLYDMLDAEGDSVMATIGAFITGHVDIAKDPWVPVLNINEYTYDIHIYLARAGMGLRALWFCSQPIMRKLADLYIQAGGYLFDTRDEGAWTRRKKAFNNFETSLLKGEDTWYKDLVVAIKNYGNQALPNKASQRRKDIQNKIDNALYVIQQIFGVNPDNPSEKINTFRKKGSAESVEGTILQDIALHHNNETDIYDPTPRYVVQYRMVQPDGSVQFKDKEISVKDVQFYVYLANIMIDDAVSDMKKLVQLSKIETKKQGKNRAEQLAYDMNYNQFFGNGRTKIMLPYTVLRMARQSSIETKQRLFMDSMSDMLKEQILSYTPAYYDFINDFIRFGSTRRDAATIKSIINGISAWLKYQFIKQYADRNKINLRDLFIGDNSIYNELGRLKAKIIENPAVYDRYTDGNGRITNAIIARLLPSDIPPYVQVDYGDNLPKFVDFQINQDDTSATSTDMKAGWTQMLTDNEHEDIQQFARRLVVYAFMTSGDTNRFGSFFNKVPMYWRNEESINEAGDSYIDYIKHLLQRFNNPEEGLDENGEWAIDLYGLKNEDIFMDILRNNWFDNNLVPTIQETSKDEFGRVVRNYSEYLQNGKPILIALVKTWTDDANQVHVSEPTQEAPKPLIKIHKHDHDSYKNPQDFRFYELVRMGTIEDENGNLISFPIYGRTNSTGGLMYGHTIIQYGDDLDFGWEKDVVKYTDILDSKFKEGMYQLYKDFEIQFDRNIQAVREGLVSAAEYKQDVVKNLQNVPIVGSFEDGTPIELTMSNSTNFYLMTKMMAQYLMLHPSKNIERDYHTGALSDIKKAKTSTKESAIDKWNQIKNSEKTESHGVTLSTSPSSFMLEYEQWQSENPDGIVAYRVNSNTFNTKEAVSNGIIGNPFDWRKHGEGTAVDLFFDWIINGNNHGEPLATKEFRDAIIEKIRNTSIPNIFYYKELNRHSHATVIGYIIENKDVLISNQELNKDIDVWSTNRDKYSNLSNVAIRPFELDGSLSTIVDPKIINSVTKKAGKNKFNSVEQLFQLIKFEMMREHIRSKAEEMFGLDRLKLQSSKDRDAMAIRQILSNIAQKEDRIAEANGSTITSISHEAIPDINNLVKSFFEEKWNQGGPKNYETSTAYQVMRDIMLQSFLQNPGATKTLLSTENATITHNKGSVYWKEAFPAALMSVRDEIRETYNNLVDLENKGITMLGGNEFAYQEYSIPIKYAKEGKMFSDVEPFFTEEEAQQIKDAIPQGSHLVVSSASRHTDPVFYATKIIDMLRQNASKPFSDPSRINVIEIWSKHDGIPMQNILEACKKYRVAPIVSFSITGLGNSVIEPGVMKADDLLNNIEKLVKVGILDPRTTTFRVDPILPGVSSVDELRHIIERGVEIGIRKFVTSPMQTYSTQKDRQGNSRSVIPHINAALKSDPNSAIKYPDAILPDGTYNWMKIYGLHYDQKRNPGAIAFTPKKEFIKPYVDMFNEMMAKYDITIQSCAVAMGNLKPSACLDPEIIEAVTSISVDAIQDKTRPFCQCYGVHSDLFRMNDECNSSCTYCYQGWAKASPFDYYDENGKLKDFSYAKVNEYEEMESGPAEVVIKDKKYTYNEGSVVDESGNNVDEATKQRVIWKRAVDLGKAHLVNVNGIYYVATNTGLIFNWGTAKVENFSNTDELKKKILSNLQSSSYDKPSVATLFNAQELKQLGESRRKFCKR